jgi:hypothetical protein
MAALEVRLGHVIHRGSVLQKSAALYFQKEGKEARVGYKFDPYIDPRAPLDPSDPCPPGWAAADYASDRSMRSQGFEPPHLRPYAEWEERELKRAAAGKARLEKRGGR